VKQGADTQLEVAMKRMALNLMLLGSIFAAPAMVGCDRTVSEDKTTKTNSDGSTETKKQKTVEKSDGTVETTKTKDVQK
jgi:hypothetical protein